MTDQVSAAPARGSFREHHAQETGFALPDDAKRYRKLLPQTRRYASKRSTLNEAAVRQALAELNPENASTLADIPREMLAGISIRKLQRILAPQTPRAAVVRDARWWGGVIILTVSVTLVGLVAQIALFSGLQHARDQSLAYESLRESLAAAIAPIGQLDVDGVMVESGTPIALLDIPSIGIHEVIRQGTTALVLRGGPGHERDTVMPGQAGTSIIQGRQTTYGGPFRSLSTITPGTEFTVTTGQGMSTFIVFGIRRAGDPLPVSLEKGQGRLQLVTADGPSLAPTGALYIDAQLTSETFNTPSTVFLPAALPAAEKPMALDGGAAFGVLLALQWLFLAAAAVLYLGRRMGFRSTWMIGTPILLALGVLLADNIASALPNLL